jgi:hypothetical protein
MSTSYSYPQSAFSHSEIKYLRTGYGTQLQLSSYKGEHGYVVSIQQFYYDAIDQKNVFMSASVSESNLNLLEEELTGVYDYYINWSVTAEENKVKEVEKEIPVRITAIQDLGCFAYAWNSDKKSVKFIFKVQNYKPYYVLNISLGFLNRRYYFTDWWFYEGECFGLIDEIKDSIRKQKEIDNKQQNTKDLFK